MAVISNDTFDPLKIRCNVRLQQGVPIIDADWNELDDIRQFELRAYLKWFVGDGVPEGNDGFRVDATGIADDFLVNAGVPAAPGGTSNIDKALSYVGRCIVNGVDVVIQTNTTFKTQPLHPSQGGAAALAIKLGVPVIALTSLSVAGPVTLAAYLDVWDRLVSPTEDPTMVLPALGVESCARKKREWVVRIRASADAPIPGDADYIAGHSYYVLARINRPLGLGAITAAQVVDRREKRLLTPPSTLIPDMLGTSVGDYRRGLGRPPISFRDAINAMIKGEPPSGPDGLIRAVQTEPLEYVFRGAFLDGANGLVVVWTSTDFFTIARVIGARLDLGNIAAGFGAPVQLTPGVIDLTPAGTVLPNGQLILAYVSTNLFYKKAATFATLSAAAPQLVAASPGSSLTDPPLAIPSGATTVVFFYEGAASWFYRRLTHTTGAWLDAAPIAIATATGEFHASADATGNIWGAGIVSAGLRTFRLNPATNVTDTAGSFNSAVANTYSQPFVLTLGGDTWVFWRSPQGLRFVRFHAGSWSADNLIPGTTTDDNYPSATPTPDGQIALFFQRNAPSGSTIGGSYLIFCNPTTGGTGAPLFVTSSSNGDFFPSATLLPDKSFLLTVVRSSAGFSARGHYKQLYPTF